MKCLVLAAALMGSVFGLPAISAHDVPKKITGIYSDMSYNAEGGDLLGDEIFLVFSDRGYYVIYQESEGAVYAPIIIPAKVEGSSVSFTLPPSADRPDQPTSFQGKVTNDELVGTFKFKNTEQTVRLKRKNSYWQ